MLTCWCCYFIQVNRIIAPSSKLQPLLLPLKSSLEFATSICVQLDWFLFTYFQPKPLLSFNFCAWPIDWFYSRAVRVNEQKLINSADQWKLNLFSLLMAKIKLIQSRCLRVGSGGQATENRAGIRWRHQSSQAKQVERNGRRLLSEQKMIPARLSYWKTAHDKC